MLYGRHNVFVWVDGVELGRLDDGVCNGRGEGAASGLATEVISATDSGASDAAFGAIIVEPDIGIVEEAGELVPVGDGVFCCAS